MWCEEKGLVIGNTLFKKRDIHKYTWISGNGEQKALMDYVLIDRCEKDRLTDVNVLRGAAGGLSDHHLIVAKVKIGCMYVKRRPRGNEKEIVRVTELNKEDCRRRYECKGRTNSKDWSIWCAWSTWGK